MRKSRLILGMAFAVLVFLVLPTLTHAHLIYGPTKFLKTTQGPNIYPDSFEVCNPEALYRLIVENGEAYTAPLREWTLSIVSG